MKISIAFIIIALSLLFIPLFQPHFKQLYALTGGTWVMKTKTGITAERWLKVSATALKSQGFKVAGKDTTFEESVQLIQQGKEIYYISTVNDENGGKPIPFKLINVKGNKFTFSNPRHDFPQNIVYDLVSPDSLHAWIDGTTKGKYLKFDFNYRRQQQ